MLNIYRTDERVLNKLTDFRDGVWVQPRIILYDIQYLVHSISN